MATSTIQLKEFCRLFGFPDRPVRFVLEQGYVPTGVDEHPSTGNRREFGPRQAFWLAIAVLLRSNGMKTRTAAEMAELTTEGLRILSQNLVWDAAFLPMSGWFQTEYQHYLDVGDLRYVRLVTNANPSFEGLFEFPWRSVKKSGSLKGIAPYVLLRVDLTKIAHVLSKVPGWNSTRSPDAKLPGKRVKNN